MSRKNDQKRYLADAVFAAYGLDESTFDIEVTSTFNSQFVKDCYLYGGIKFIKALEKYGVNENGEGVNLLDWHYEFAGLIGDFRVPVTLTTGCAQIGKTLFHTFLICHCLTEGGLNTLWSYDQERSLNVQVPSNFRPVIERWLKKAKIKNIANDMRNNTIYQVLGATAQFVYVSTSKMAANKDKAAAGGNVVGVSRDVLVHEERSQYPPGSADPLKFRLAAGRVPSRPVRELGTPGAGNGIEAEIEQADYEFYPHYHCPDCGTTAPLHPKGCLLLEYQGKYLSPTGRPLNWRIDDDGQAFFGCIECDRELTPEIRSKAWFQCLRTGIKLKDYLEALPPEEPKKRVKAGIHLSPLLRMRSGNLAQEMIDGGLKALNTDDWQQQGLGIPSENNTTAVTLDLFRKAITKSPITTKPDVTIAGADQGRGEDWLWVCKYYLPQDKSLTIAQIIEQSTRHVLFGGDIVRTEIPDTLEYLQVDYGLYDNEPDISNIAEVCDRTCFEMADQKSGLLDAVKHGIVRDGGSEYPCWKIRNEKFLKQVLNSFILEKFHLPNDWDKWLGDRSERSPFLHLTGPSYDPGSGKWKRGGNHLDDLFYAAAFCEAAFYVWLTERSKESGFSLWSKLTDR